MKTAYHVKVWAEGETFASRSTEVILADSATAEKYFNKVKRAMGWKKADLDARYPSVGIDITPIFIYETVDEALDQSWPFEELIDA